MQSLPEAPLTSSLPSHPRPTSTSQVLVGPSSVPSAIAPSSPRKERRNARHGFKGLLEWSQLPSGPLHLHYLLAMLSSAWGLPGFYSAALHP